MKSKDHKITIIFFLFCYFAIIRCFLQTAYEIHDLEGKDEACFNYDADEWTYSFLVPYADRIYPCDDTYLLGGSKWTTLAQKNHFFERTYSNLPSSHTTIRFSMTFWALGGWEYLPYPGTGDRIQLIIDGLLGPLLFALDSADYTGFPNLCGNVDFGDVRDIFVFGSIAHSSTSLTLRFLNLFSGTPPNEAFGLRDIKLFFSTSSYSPPLCVNSPVKAYVLDECDCLRGFYNSGGMIKICTACHPNCASCYGGNENDCYECNEGSYFDGTGCKSCDISCKRCSGPNINECENCYEDFVLFEGACISENRCAPPFTPTACVNTCISPCDVATKASWTENCFPPCPIGEISDLIGICHKCEALNIQYLKENKNGHEYRMSLIPSTCDLDLATVLRYINLTEQIPNSIGPFTYEALKTDNNVFLIKIHLSKSTLKPSNLEVKLSHLKGVLVIPKMLLPDPSLEGLAESAPAVQTTISVVLGGSLVGTLALGATSSLWSIISFQQFVGYFIYINIEYPQQVEIFFEMLQASFWDYLPNPTVSLTESLYQKVLGSSLNSDLDPPRKFVKHEMSSFFIENGSTILLTNISFLLLLLFVLSLKKSEKLANNRILKTIKVYLKWNVIARTFLENGIPLSLAIFLQLRVLSSEGAYLMICTFMTLISSIYFFIFTIFLFQILSKRNNKHLRFALIKKIYGTLYEGVVLNNTGKYYHLIILLRGVFLTFLVTILDNYPLLQIVSLIFVNAGFVYYLFKEVVMEDSKLNVIVRVKEVFIFIGQIGILLLGLESTSESYYKIVGWIIVGFLCSALLIELGYMVLLQILGIKEIYRKIISVLRSICSPGSNQSGKKKKINLRKINIENKKIDESVVSTDKSMVKHETSTL